MNKHLLLFGLKITLPLIVIAFSLYGLEFQASNFTGAFSLSALRAVSSTVQTDEYGQPIELQPTLTLFPSLLVESNALASANQNFIQPQTLSLFRIVQTQSCEGITQDQQVLLDWLDSLEMNFSHYEVEQISGPEEVFTSSVVSTISQYQFQLPAVDGEYSFRGRAVKFDGATSEWSDTCSITLDQTAPVSQLALVGDEASNIDQELLKEDEVSVIEMAENGVTPFGTQMVRLENTEFLLEGDANFISFAYNFGNDQNNNAKLTLMAGEEQVKEMLAQEALEGWHVVTIDVSDAPEKKITLVVEKEEDGVEPAYVYIDEINLHQATEETALHFVVTDQENDPANQMYYGFSKDGQEQELTGPSPLAFSLTSLDGNEFKYWATDALGNKEEAHVFALSLEKVSVGKEDQATGEGDAKETALALLYDAAAFTVTLDIQNTQDFTEYSYEVTYTHLVDGQEVQEALVGEGQIDLEVGQVVTEPLYLGTCSEQGVVCVPHLEAANFEATVILKGSGLPERTLTQSEIEQPSE